MTTPHRYSTTANFIITCLLFFRNRFAYSPRSCRTLKGMLFFGILFFCKNTTRKEEN